MIMQCCKCHRVKTQTGWVDAEHMDGVSHGYCPVCVEDLKAMVEQLKRENEKPRELWWERKLREALCGSDRK